MHDFNEGKVGHTKFVSHFGVEFMARAKVLVKVATGESDNW